MFQMYVSLCLVLADFKEHMSDLLNRNCIAHMPNVEHMQKKILYSLGQLSPCPKIKDLRQCEEYSVDIRKKIQLQNYSEG